MTTEYLGNETRKYIFDTGKVITLTDAELESLCTENESYKAMAGMKKRLKQDLRCMDNELNKVEDRNYRLSLEIGELEKQIRNDTDNMTLEEFNTTSWTGGMQVEYLSNIYDVASLDFETKIIWIEKIGD